MDVREPLNNQKGQNRMPPEYRFILQIKVSSITIFTGNINSSISIYL